jgi:hypothetical protein
MEDVVGSTEELTGIICVLNFVLTDSATAHLWLLNWHHRLSNHRLSHRLAHRLTSHGNANWLLHNHRLLDDDRLLDHNWLDNLLRHISM